MELDATEPVDSSENTAPSSDVVPPDRPHKFVTFFIGNRHYALHSSAVAEVTTKLKSTPLPDAPEALVGIAPLRGEIVAVVDLAIDSPLPASADKQKTVVMKCLDPEADMPVAFNVDRLGEFISIDPQNISTFVDETDSLASLEAKTENGPVRIVEPARLSAALHR